MSLLLRCGTSRPGFALPTLLVVSVAMLIIMASAVAAVGTTRTALNDQYYNQLAREAAESGLARANSCLQSNGYIASWGASSLYPNTSCSGGAPCTNNNNCYVLRSGDVTTSFQVPAPVNQNGTQSVTVQATVSIVRHGTSSVWKSYGYSLSSQVGANVTFNNVAFGYFTAGSGGAYFLTIAADGTVHSVGANAFGQLGNGTTTATTSPVLYTLPNGVVPVKLFTNFVSNGLNTFVLSSDGRVYGAGSNSQGQLGDGTTIDRSTPVQLQLPSGKAISNITSLGSATFILAVDNNLYAVGACTTGVLGSSYTIAGCSNQITPQRVALPVPSSDLNTVPTTNLSTDRSSAVLRMQGGRVYGWGANDTGQFGNGTVTSTSVPVQIGTYGDSGQPKATQVATDGVSTYVVDSDGGIMATGYNLYGELGNAQTPILNPNTGKCFDNKSADGVTMQLYTCNGTGAQQWMWNSDNTLVNVRANKCLDNAGGNTTTVQLYTCNGTGAQQWVLRSDGTVYNPARGLCIENKSGDGATLWLTTCSATAYQKWQLPYSTSLVPFAMPASAGTAVKVATDQWFVSVLTSKGQVWSAGMNDQGQLGNGKTAVAQAMPVQFILPNGVTATDVYSTSYSGLGSPSSNTYVIGSDGKVYGAGSNGYGQLGDGTTTNRSTPVAMRVIDGVNIRAQQVQSGYGTTVVLTTGNKVYTVGNNASGQLGNGTTTNSSTPYANRYTNILPVIVF